MRTAPTEPRAGCKSCPRQPRHVYSSGTHIQVIGERAGLHHLLVEPGIILPPKKDVLTDSGRLYPRLLCGQTKSLLQATNIHSSTLSAGIPEVDGKGNKAELLPNQNGLQIGIAVEGLCLLQHGRTRQGEAFRLLT